MGATGTIDGIKMASVTSSDSMEKGALEDTGPTEAAVKSDEEGSTTIKSVSFSELLRRVTPRFAGPSPRWRETHGLAHALRQGPKHAGLLTASTAHCNAAKRSPRIKCLWRWVCWRQP